MGPLRLPPDPLWLDGNPGPSSLPRYRLPHGPRPPPAARHAPRAGLAPDGRLPRLRGRVPAVPPGGVPPRGEDGPARVSDAGRVEPLSRLAQPSARRELLRSPLLRPGRPHRGRLRRGHFEP